MRKSLRFASSLLCGGASMFISQLASAQSSGSENIRLNQIGFYPNGPKTAVIISAQATLFSMVSAGNEKDTVFRGNLKKTGVWKYSNEETAQADFSSFKKPGSYVLFVKGIGNSHPFDIKDHVNEGVAKASIKGYYYQRTAMELTPEFAGKFARAAGHPDNEVLIHNSAASPNRPTGAKINSSKGWYDAGDYNKYIVNSGITMSTLFSLYEDFPEYNKTLNVNIPESKNQLPDLLDEANWNLRWMFTMQDPADGGVYHKLTNANFDGVVIPKDATNPRYVIMKTTAATLDFAATLAHASRIYRNFEQQCPGLADSCLTASKKAYDWAKKNPAVLYANETQKGLHDPAIQTGAYEDTDIEDELLWAASELFVTTGDMAYFKDANLDVTMAKNITIPNWQSVGMLGLYTLVKNADRFSANPNVKAILEALKSKFVTTAKSFQTKAAASAYGVTMGECSDNDFVWGSNAIVGNQGVFLIKAYLLSKDNSLLDAAEADFDYLLGRNAVGYSFLTGFGDKATMHPHHRPSEADDIVDPVPGLLAGGPNPGQQDLAHCNGAKYPSALAAKSYLDLHCSYASNEIAINWNAPFVYIANALEAIRNK
jgi:endoglucanase